MRDYCGINDTFVEVILLAYLDQTRTLLDKLFMQFPLFVCLFFPFRDPRRRSLLPLIQLVLRSLSHPAGCARVFIGPRLLCLLAASRTR